ncbi:DUF3500 domain-containing protein [uncultured Maribacter sp.]|uniref:DUF3500 domain-containing protein n=1 Tax=uncultured Maribacter sp. TaxID=431308 RepID=UPI0030DC3DF9|tara:strand:- start:8020 stop:9234 length:1215 start_codon:yes stop_codon:yes gene_type:complete
MKKITFVLILSLAIGCKQSPSQDKVVDNPPNTSHDQGGPTAYFAKLQSDAIQEAFEGITTDKGKETGLFPIRTTGVSTQPIKEAAEEFLNAMSSSQKERASYAIEDDEWRKWCNVDNGIYVRQGVSLKEMDSLQKSMAFNLMQTSLSAKGLTLSKDIMKTDQTLKELNNGSDAYDEELYWFTFMGTPSNTEPWGWQLDGHHLVINYFILGDQVVMSPVFMGGEPIITTSGKYKGNSIFQDEQNLGLALMQSFSAAQQKEATLSMTKERDVAKAEAFKDNAIINYEGLPISKLTESQKEALLQLTAQYINNIREGHQQIKMEEIKAHLDNTWFAWVGSTEDDAVFYYRIHSPVVLIEFDHQKAVGVPHDKNSGPTRNHIHTVVRTPNGNDYGKDLLKQHLKEHHH